MRSMCFICFSTVVWYNVISAEKNKRRQGRHLFFCRLINEDIPSAWAEAVSASARDPGLHRKKRNKRRQRMELSLYRNEKGHPFAYVPFYHQPKRRLAGRGWKVWRAIAGYMDRHNIEYEAVLTNGTGEARDACQGADQGSRKAMLPYCCRRRRHHERGIRWSILPWSFKSGLYPG